MRPVAAPADPEAARELRYQGASSDVPAATASEADDGVMLLRSRLSRIYFNKQFFDYPLKLNPDTLLKLGRDFEARHGMAAKIERNLWLERDLLQPDYAGRPWTLWTANSALASDHVADRLRWVVARP